MKKKNTKMSNYEKVKKKSKPGNGKRFKALTSKLMSEGKSKSSATAIAASIGRKKYGTKKMTNWAKKSKKR